MFRFWGCAVIVLNIGPKVRIILDDFNKLTYVFLLVMCVCNSVMSDSLRPYGLQPSRLLCPWAFQGKSTWVGWPFLLQGIFSAQGLNSGFLHCLQILYHLSHQGNMWASKERDSVKKKLLPKSDGDSEWELPWVFWKSLHPWPKNLTPNKTWDGEDRD